MNLQGRCVIVTRPARQAESLCAALEADGAQVIRLPLIEIRPLDSEPVAGADNYHWLIFTSPNAVRHGLDRVRHSPARFAAVGAATAQALQTAGHGQVLLPPDDYSSEGLLACPEMRSVQDQRILLIKGQGGRQLLAEQLNERGARVDELVVYVRHPLNPPAAQVADAVNRADSVIVTSEQILQQLVDSCPAAVRPKLRALQLVVPSERVVKRARELGFGDVDCASSPLTETTLVQALQSAKRHRPH